MKKVIALISEILPQDGVDADEVDIDAVVEAQNQLVEISRPEHLQSLLEALNSPKNDFWTRELISEAVIKVGGLSVISDLFEAFETNLKEGHDNDMMCHLLSELAIDNKNECRIELLKILNDSKSNHHESAKWLLEFCD